MPPAELDRMRERDEFWAPERAYFEVQSTKPQTIGYSLNDSPVGLAAWIVDKLQVLCDCPNGLEDSFTKDEVLSNITLYWVTETPTSAARMYYERAREAPEAAYIDVPTGAALFPKEIMLPPRKWAEARFNIVRWTEMPRGGHFAALEEPALLIEDVRASSAA